MRATDEEIVSRSNVEPERFGEIFDRHFASIHAYLARRLALFDRHMRMHAADGTQPTYVIVRDEIALSVAQQPVRRCYSGAWT